MMLRPGEDGATLYQAHCENMAVAEIIGHYGLPNTPESNRLALRIYYGPPIERCKPVVKNADADDWKDIPF